MQTSKIFFPNPIQDIIQNAKRQSTAQALSVNIPQLVQTGNQNYDALVYSTIEVVSFGRTIDGKEASNIKLGNTNINNWRLIALPPPLEIIDLHSANWEGISLGLMKAGLDENRGLSPGSAGISSFLDSIGNAINEFGNANKVGQVFERSFLGENIYNMGSIAAGVSINPNIELAFRSANLRQIQLQYRLVPLTQIQGMQFENFVDVMKILMYGSNTANGQYAPGFIGFPAKFIVKVKSTPANNNQGKILFSMGDVEIPVGDGVEKAGCVLTDLQVSYSENGSYAGHYDGRPGFINLNLTFQETLQSTRDSIVKEYGL